MKKKGILNSELSYVLASMGHYHRLMICDAGFPIPLNVQRVDLCVVAGLPPFMDVLQAILAQMEIQKAFIARQTREISPDRNQQMLDALSEDVEIVVVDQKEIMDMSHDVIACVRTGECTPFSNIILESGVIF